MNKYTQYISYLNVNMRYYRKMMLFICILVFAVQIGYFSFRVVTAPTEITLNTYEETEDYGEPAVRTIASAIRFEECLTSPLFTVSYILGAIGVLFVIASLPKRKQLGSSSQFTLSRLRMTERVQRMLDFVSSILILFLY